YRDTSTFVIFSPHGTLRSQAKPDVMYNSTKLIHSQIRKNGQPYFDNPLTTDHEHYLQFLERYKGQQAFNVGSLISKDEWLRFCRVYVYNTHRLKDPKNMITSGFAMDGQFTRTTSEKVD